MLPYRQTDKLFLGEPGMYYDGHSTRKVYVHDQKPKCISIRDHPGERVTNFFDSFLILPSVIRVVTITGNHNQKKVEH